MTMTIYPPDPTGGEADDDSDYDPEDQDEEIEEDAEGLVSLLRQQPVWAADEKLMGVYDEFTIDRNTGEHLHGGVADDVAMQYLYNIVCSYSHPLYSPPKGHVGNTFIKLLTKEWMLARTRVTNSERAEIFPACILRKERGCSQSDAIRRRIARRMQLWEDGKYAELAEDVVRAAKAGWGTGRSPPWR